AVLADTFGRVMFNIPVNYVPTFGAASAWLALAVGIAVLACALPAWRALAVPTGRALGYEESATAGQSRFALEAEVPRVFLAHSGPPRLRGVNVADGHVAVCRQRMQRQLVRGQIGAHVAFIPVGERMQLPASIAQFEKIDIPARGCLAATK